MTLILCPLHAELQALVHGLKTEGYVVTEERAKNLPVYICKELQWILSLGGHGKTQFALHTQFLTAHFPVIKNIICAGTCGALAPELKLNDVVIATQTIEHDYKQFFIKQPLPAFPARETLLDRIKIKTSDLQLNIHFGPIASGDEDIVDLLRRQELFTATNALAVAWEGAGGARASKFLNIPFVEIRGVTDNANRDTLSDFKENLQTAMSAVYKVLILSFKKY